MDVIKNIGEVFAMLSDVERSKFQYDIEHLKSVYGQICYRHGYEDRDKEIVRCEDCKHSLKHSENVYECGCFCAMTTPKFYCADGERKETE